MESAIAGGNQHAFRATLKARSSGRQQQPITRPDGTAAVQP